jgi:hypothetical protein
MAANFSPGSTFPARGDPGRYQTFVNEADSDGTAPNSDTEPAARILGGHSHQQESEKPAQARRKRRTISFLREEEIDRAYLR